ncbi:MAG: response regulator, partial [bacterium]|nr:response regulator [bacterium]
MATILLVDDEKIIRTLVRVALEQHDYHVLEAGSGRRAIAVARKHSGPVDLLLAELSLPRMSGVEL